MERATFSVSFFVKRTKKLKDGTLPIFVRITVNGERAEFGLQESVNLNQWTSFQKRKAGSSSSSKYLNSLFDHANQVWYTDITYIPMAKGFMYMTA